MFFRYTLLAGATLYVVVYLILAFYRIQYPFELEWMEGGSLDHVRRILAGQKLYVSPSLEFVPFIYTPLYFYLSAIVSNIMDFGFVPLRLVSFISSLGSLFLIFLVVRRETRSNFWGIVASSLFAATFRISGAWFDIARVDSLFLFFLLAAIYLIRFHTSLRSIAFAGVLISLAFLTKQTALLIAVPIMLYYVSWERRSSIVFISTIVTTIGISTLFLNYIHGGWYTYYVFGLPGQHSIDTGMFIYFWIEDILRPLCVACIMSASYIFAELLYSNRRDSLFYLTLAMSMVGASLAGRLNLGSGHNSLFPAYASISILFGLGMHKAFQFIELASTGQQPLVRVCFYLVCIIQFVILAYDPFSQLPTQKDLEAGEELVNTIRQIEGEVYVPLHSYLPVLAGKNSYAHHIAIGELLGAFGGVKKEAGTKFINELRQAIRDKRFGAIIVDSDWLPNIEEYYVKQRRVFDSQTVFWPLRGYRPRPVFIYVPKRSDAY